jgi:hypothetical protein
MRLTSMAMQWYRGAEQETNSENNNSADENEIEAQTSGLNGDLLGGIDNPLVSNTDTSID